MWSLLLPYQDKASPSWRCECGVRVVVPGAENKVASMIERAMHQTIRMVVVADSLRPDSMCGPEIGCVYVSGVVEEAAMAEEEVRLRAHGRPSQESHRLSVLG